MADPVYDNPVFYYYHCDHLSSTSIMTNANGYMVQHHNYSAFGNAIGTGSENSSAFRVSNRYTGQILDEDTGLYFYGARYYDPELARFVQADPVIPEAGSSQALNRYSYCINNPLKYVDPTGNVMMYPSSYNDYGYGSWSTSAVSGGFYNSFSYLTTPSSSYNSIYPSHTSSFISSYSSHSSFSSYSSSYSFVSALITPDYGAYYQSIGINFDMPDLTSQFSNLHSITTPAYFNMSPSDIFAKSEGDRMFEQEKEWFKNILLRKGPSTIPERWYSEWANSELLTPWQYSILFGWWDSQFYESGNKDKIYTINGWSSYGHEINYYFMGMLMKHRGITRERALLMVKINKLRYPGDEQWLFLNPDTTYYLWKGYDEWDYEADFITRNREFRSKYYWSPSANMFLEKPQ